MLIETEGDWRNKLQSMEINDPYISIESICYWDVQIYGRCSILHREKLDLYKWKNNFIEPMVCNTHKVDGLERVYWLTIRIQFW